MHVVSITLPAATVQKVRVYIGSVLFNGIGFKVGLYDSNNNLMTSGSATLNVSDIGRWKEVSVTSRNVSAGTYRIAWVAFSGGYFDVRYRYQNGNGTTRLSDQTLNGGYWGFPQNPLTGTSYTLGGSDAAGVCAPNISTPTPTATPTVTPTVTPTPTATPTPGQITLSARGYKVQGRQTVDLSWTGATSSSVDIYRDGLLIVTVPNNGFYTDQPNGRGQGNYTYKVCEAGTANCSNQVTVTF